MPNAFTSRWPPSAGRPCRRLRRRRPRGAFRLLREHVSSPENRGLRQRPEPRPQQSRSGYGRVLGLTARQDQGTTDEPLPLAECPTDGAWVTVRAKIVELWEPREDSIHQVGPIGGESGRLKFVAWAKSNLPTPQGGHDVHVQRRHRQRIRRELLTEDQLAERNRRTHRRQSGGY